MCVCAHIATPQSGDFAVAFPFNVKTGLSPDPLRKANFSWVKWKPPRSPKTPKKLRGWLGGSKKRATSNKQTNTHAQTRCYLVWLSVIQAARIQVQKLQAMWPEDIPQSQTKDELHAVQQEILKFGGSLTNFL